MMDSPEAPTPEPDDDFDDFDDDVGGASGPSRARRALSVVRSTGRAASKQGGTTARREARAAGETFEGTGSAMGVAVGMFALVLLYLLLTRTKALAALIANISTWLTKFLSPYHPLIG